jgi:hypothetical protein
MGNFNLNYNVSFSFILLKYIAFFTILTELVP